MNAMSQFILVALFSFVNLLVDLIINLKLLPLKIYMYLNYCYTCIEERYILSIGMKSAVALAITKANKKITAGNFAAITLSTKMT